MSSNQKHSSLSWTLAISLGIAFSAGVAHAGSIGDTYTAGDTLTAAKMDNIKAAVNDNDTRIGTLTTTVGGHTTSIGTLTTTVGGHTTSIGTLTTDVNNLKNGTPTCGTGTTAVGPTCVDNARAAAGATWIAAVNACRTAGKRLLTPGEYMAAKSLGTVPDMATNGQFEWVDVVSSDASADITLSGGHAGRLIVGYMGPSNSIDTPTVPDGDIFFGNNAAYDASFGYIYYRCAR